MRVKRRCSTSIGNGWPLYLIVFISFGIPASCKTRKWSAPACHLEGNTERREGDGWLRGRTRFIPLCILHDNEPTILFPFVSPLSSLLFSPLHSFPHRPPVSLFSRVSFRCRRCMREQTVLAGSHAPPSIHPAAYNTDISTHACPSYHSTGINGRQFPPGWTVSQTPDFFLFFFFFFFFCRKGEDVAR